MKKFHCFASESLSRVGVQAKEFRKADTPKLRAKHRSRSAEPRPGSMDLYFKVHGRVSGIDPKYSAIRGERLRFKSRDVAQPRRSHSVETARNTDAPRAWTRRDELLQQLVKAKRIQLPAALRK